MPTISLSIKIQAHPKLVFDLTRSIEAHLSSTAQTQEKAVDGKMSGLMYLGDTVTWEAKHLGVVQLLTSKITEYERPTLLTDVQVMGAFKSFEHRHEFQEEGNYVLVKDTFRYTAPLGILGKLADVLFLKNYMTRFLTGRNNSLKALAESDQWKTLIPSVYHSEYQ